MKKIYTLLSHPLILPLSWFAYLAIFPAGYIRYYYLSNFSEGMPILGKMANLYWHSSPVLLTIFVTVLAVNVLIFTRKIKKARNKISVYIVGSFSIFTFFAANYFLGLELSKYRNYLYSVFGIPTSDMSWLSTISLVVMVVFAGLIYLGMKHGARNNKLMADKVIVYLSLGILIWFSLLSFSKVTNFIWYAKFNYSWVFENYGKIEKLKNETSPEANIIIPFQGLDWPDISNSPIVRYFLFPRTIVSSQFLSDQNKANEIGEAYFMLLDNKDKFWPTINEKEKVINFGDLDLMYKELTKINDDVNDLIYKISFTQ